MAIFKKAGGRIFGVQFNAKEKRAIEKELLTQCAEYDRKNANEVDALVLWVLHEKYGFGKKRLRAFYNYFKSALSELLERYEMGDADTAWLCTHKLKEYGIDIEKWNEED